MASDVVVTVASKGVAEVVDDFKKVEKAAEGAAPATRNLSKGIDSVGESGGNAERALQGVADITGFLGEQVGINLGPLNEYAGAFAQLGGGVEAALQGGPALLAQLKALPGTLAGAITATWAYVSALVAQAAAFIAANAPLIAIIAGLALLTAGVILVIKYWDEIVAKVPFLGTAFEAVKGVITPAIDAITGAFQAVLTWLQSNWPIVATIISGPFAPIVLLATDAFGVRSALQGAFEGVLGWVRSNWPEIATVISGPFAPIVLLATDAFGVRSALQDAFTEAAAWIGQKMEEAGGFISGLLTFIQGMGSSFWDAARNIGSNIWEGLVAGAGDLYGLGVGLIQDLWNGISSMGGWLLGQLQSFASNYLDPRNWGIPGLSPLLPAYHHAGQLMVQNLAGGMESAAPELMATQQNIGNELGLVVGGQIVSSAAYGGGGGGSRLDRFLASGELTAADLRAMKASGREFYDDLPIDQAIARAERVAGGGGGGVAEGVDIGWGIVNGKLMRVNFGKTLSGSSEIYDIGESGRTDIQRLNNVELQRARLAGAVEEGVDAGVAELVVAIKNMTDSARAAYFASPQGANTKARLEAAGYVDTGDLTFRFVGAVTQAIITDFEEVARTPGTFDKSAEAILDQIDNAFAAGLPKVAEGMQKAFDEFYYLAATPQGEGYLARRGGGLEGGTEQWYANQMASQLAASGGMLFPGQAGYVYGSMNYDAIFRRFGHEPFDYSPYAGGTRGMGTRAMRRGMAGEGGMTLQVNAVDAQSFRDWLNRGGGDQIAKWFGQRKSFA